MSGNNCFGHLSLVLHAHLPFVRHPEHPVFLEENWLFEALTECYLPLADRLHGLLNEKIPFRLTMSLSPPLCEMFCDELLRDRYSARLASLIELCHNEVRRLDAQPEFKRLAEMYLRRLTRIQHLYENVFGRDMVGAFRKLQDAGCLEIIACAATHAFLPLIKHPRCLRAQIRMGVKSYKRHFHCDPEGIWLPECAYVPGLDQELAAEKLRYFFLDSHGLLFGTPRPKYGTYAPVFCRSHVAAFARDIETSKQVWSAETGYPGDPAYREFYRDLGYDAEFDTIAPYIHPDGIRHDIGIKYHRVTGEVPLQEKAVYDPAVAAEKARAHAANFIFNRQEQARHLQELLKHKPLIVAPYDAELFGHWWYEGPEFLEHVFRTAAQQTEVRLVTPGEYLIQNPTLQVVDPSASSWGDKGYFEVWLNGGNDWIYRHLHKAEERMCRLVDAHADADALQTRALNQMARELMLAQSSDWAFIMTTGTMVPYAEKRVRDHARRFNELHDMIETGAIDEARLADLEARDNIFPDMDFRVYTR